MENNIFRPYLLNDFVGKQGIKDNLKIYISAALKRNEALDHILLYGPAGLGKTSIGYIIAHEMDCEIHYVSAPSIEKIGDLAAILSLLNPGDILFIDEIHRLPKNCEEVLYSAMEDFKINVLINNNLESRNLELNLPPFTLIGATTKAGILSRPLRDRFGIKIAFDYYTNDELKKIVENLSRLFDFDICKEGVDLLANCSRGIPRVCVNIMRRIRDYCTYHEIKDLNIKELKNAMIGLGIDYNGLDSKDIIYLRVLNERFKGGPVGIKSIATTMNEDIDSLEDIIEPFLLRIGLINRTIKGRVITQKGRDYLLNKNNGVEIII